MTGDASTVAAAVRRLPCPPDDCGIGGGRDALCSLLRFFCWRADCWNTGDVPGVALALYATRCALLGAAPACLSMLLHRRAQNCPMMPMGGDGSAAGGDDSAAGSAVVAAGCGASSKAWH